MPEITVAPKNYLCDIEGLCAVFSKETLNGRSYSQIYRNLLDGKDYRFNEMMKRGGILCELSHPAQETADFFSIPLKAKIDGKGLSEGYCDTGSHDGKGMGKAYLPQNRATHEPIC